MATKQSVPAAPEFAPDEIVVALDGFASYPNITVAKGSRLRASSEAVQRNPLMFCRDGLTAEEMATLRDQRFPRPEPTQHQPIMREEVELTDENAVICIRGVRGTHADGDSHLGPRPLAVAVGAKVNKRDAIVKANPDCFIAVVPEGLTREMSVRAVTDNFVYQRGEDGEYIRETDGRLIQQFGEYKRFQLWHAGQCVPRSHPDVHAHPERFEILR